MLGSHRKRYAALLSIITVVPPSDVGKFPVHWVVDDARAAPKIETQVPGEIAVPPESLGLTPFDLMHGVSLGHSCSLVRYTLVPVGSVVFPVPALPAA